jgi:flavin reductase (DIM6/NTAB) family NADH-FMN oxidoreductase RutF
MHLLNKGSGRTGLDTYVRFAQVGQGHRLPTVPGVDQFNAVVDLFDYPMYVVTTGNGNERSGCLVGFATQASIDPVRFLVAISNKNHTFRVACAATRLVVHLISADERQLAELFGEHSGDDIDKFARCDWTPGPDGVPVLDAAAAWFSGRIIDKRDFGDHVGFLIEPDSGEVRDSDVRVLMDSDVSDLDAGHDA